MLDVPQADDEKLKKERKDIKRPGKRQTKKHDFNRGKEQGEGEGKPTRNTKVYASTYPKAVNNAELTKKHWYTSFTYIGPSRSSAVAAMA